MHKLRLAVAGLAMLWTGSALAAETVTYSYDARGRLVQVTHSGGPASGVQATYTHDKASNRTRVQVTGASH